MENAKDYRNDEPGRSEEGVELGQCQGKTGGVERRRRGRSSLHPEQSADILFQRIHHIF